jgi:hypothetical protein
MIQEKMKAVLPNSKRRQEMLWINQKKVKMLASLKLMIYVPLALDIGRGSYQNSKDVEIPLAWSTLFF